jgi:hypothetical protein
MTRSMLALLSCAALHAGAYAQDAPERPWILSLSASGSQADGDAGETFRTGNASLERQFRGFRLGASIGGSGSEVAVPELVAVADASSIQGALWWGVDVGGANLTLALGNGRQSVDGEVTPAATAPPAIRNRTGAVEGDVTTTNITGTLSRSFGEHMTWAPYGTISYSETKTDVRFVGQGAAAPRLVVSRTNSGVSGGVGLDVSYPAGLLFDLVGGVGVLAAEDGASTFYTQRRSGGFQPSAQQADGSIQWSEVYAGFNAHMGDSATLAVSFGTTLGLDQDELFTSIQMNFAFPTR